MTAQTTESQQITTNIRLDPDGVYRWTYNFEMLKNPTILITVYKVLTLSFGIICAFGLVVGAFSGDIQSWTDLWKAIMPYLILFGVFLVIGAIAYLIVAAVYGWRYKVDFEMTEEYVRHIQQTAQVEKAKKLGFVTAVVGALAKRPTTMGAGLLAASKSESTSEFANVRRVKVRKWKHTIHVNQLLDKNQVYAENEDFDFVAQFIKNHCPKAKIS